VKIFVNGEEVPFRPLREDELGPLGHIKDGVGRLFLFLESPPLRGGDNITGSNPPPEIEQVWVRFRWLDWKGDVRHGNLRVR
jgi:hypothetical protein